MSAKAKKTTAANASPLAAFRKGERAEPLKDTESAKPVQTSLLRKSNRESK